MAVIQSLAPLSKAIGTGLKLWGHGGVFISSYSDVKFIEAVFVGRGKSQACSFIEPFLVSLSHVCGGDFRAKANSVSRDTFWVL